jgi:hypothetical protein
MTAKNKTTRRKSTKPGFAKGHQINSKGGLDQRIPLGVTSSLLERLKLAAEVDASFRRLDLSHKSFSDWCRLTLKEKADKILGGAR